MADNINSSYSETGGYFMITPVSGTPATNVTAPAPAPAETKTPPQVAKKDQVDISKLAQTLASDGDTQAKEVTESGAEKATETARNKA
jgi:hypothetical protein